MDRIIGNLSIYDVLSMVIPGGTLLLFLQVLFAADSYPLSVLIIKEQELDRTILFTIGTVVSYIVGIFNHLLTTMIWGGFRNNTAYIKRELIKVMRETPDPFLFETIMWKYEYNNSNKWFAKYYRCIFARTLWVCLVHICLLFNLTVGIRFFYFKF